MLAVTIEIYLDVCGGHFFQALGVFANGGSGGGGWKLPRVIKMRRQQVLGVVYLDPLIF